MSEEAQNNQKERKVYPYRKSHQNYGSIKITDVIETDDFLEWPEIIPLDTEDRE